MNWIKKHPVLTAIAAVLLVVLLTLGYFVYDAGAKLAEINSEYESKVRKLRALQTRTPFPNAENLEKSRAELERYSAIIEDLKEQLMGRQLETPEINPQAFQDLLRQSLSEVERRAAENDVALAPGFYLGFDQYQNNLPEQAAAPLLARQLEDILYVVNSLIDLRVIEIASVNRPQIPEELGRTSRAPAPAPTPASKRASKKRDREPASEPPPAPLLVKRTFDVTFRAKQGKFRQAFNDLLDSPDFLIVRAMQIENSQQEGPLIGGGPQGGALLPPPPNPDSPAALLAAEPSDSTEPTQPTDLRMVVGRETLLITLRIEALDFEFPTADADPEKQAAN